jgi:transposase
MRGSDGRAGELFAYVDLERRVPADHPLRVIRAVVNAALSELSGAFGQLYARLGRPGVPPEKLLRALLLQAFYSIRSERQLMERLEFDLLFRWFPRVGPKGRPRAGSGLGIEDPVWDASTFSKNRERLLAGEVAARFLATVLGRPEVERLLSDDHFSVDGTLIQAWASMKSFRPKDDPAEPPPGGRNDSRDFHGERRRNETHASTTDSEARLFRKGPGKEARLSFMGHLLMENRSGLVVGTRLTQATGMAERAAATALAEAVPGRHRITVAADRAYDTAGFVAGLRALNATPHVAQNTARRASRIDRRTVRHPGYLASQRARKRIEEAFAWVKTIALQAKTRFRGTDRVGWAFTLAATAYNLIRLPRLLQSAP